MSEHRDAPKVHEPHTIHEEHAKGPHDLKEINPKMTSDIAYWSKSLVSAATSSTKRSALTERTWKKSAPPFTPTKPARFTTWLDSAKKR
jgi:hypothetical protein